MPAPVVEPSPSLPPFLPLAPDDAQDASYLAASAKIFNLRVRTSSTCSRYVLWQKPARTTDANFGSISHIRVMPALAVHAPSLSRKRSKCRTPLASGPLS